MNQQRKNNQHHGLSAENFRIRGVAGELFTPDSFKAIAETHQQVRQVSEEARRLINDSYKNPAELLAFIAAQGTPVYMLNDRFIPGTTGRLSLRLLGFDPGFIAVRDTAAYEKLCRLLRHHTTQRFFLNMSRTHHLTTPDAFENGVLILSPSQVNVAFLSHQVHHWLAYKSGLKGYSLEEQVAYQKFWHQHNGQLNMRMLQRMSIEEIYQLKNAINRDLEALKFLRQIINEVIVPSRQGRALIENSRQNQQS